MGRNCQAEPTGSMTREHRYVHHAPLSDLTSAMRSLFSGIHKRANVQIHDVVPVRMRWPAVGHSWNLAPQSKK